MYNSEQFYLPTEPGQMLMYWIAERENMRLLREAGGNWLTDDPILSTYRFCNVHRRDDKVTQWLLNNYYGPLIEGGANNEDLWLHALFVRLVNYPPTLATMMGEGFIQPKIYAWDTAGMIEYSKYAHSTALKLFNNAYMINSRVGTLSGGLSKFGGIIKLIVAEAIAHRRDFEKIQTGTSLQKYVKAMTSFVSVGDFIAGQAVADLTYLPTSSYYHATDLHTWAPIGPGSTRGLNRLRGLTGRTLERVVSQSDFNASLTQLNILIQSELYIGDLTLHDVQNCLCEFDKYMRTLTGEGVPKQIYTPKEGF